MIAALNNNRFKAGLFILLFFVFLTIAAYAEQIFFLFIPIAFIAIYLGWQHLRPVFFLLLFFLPLSTEYSIQETLSIDLPDEPLMIFLALAMITYWFYKPSILSKSITGHPVIVVLFLFFLWTIITVVFSTEPLISLKYMLAKAWYILAFVFIPMICFNDQESIKRGVSVLLVAMIGVVSIILFRHANSGLTFSTINQSVSPFFRNHVNYSAMLVCTLPILLAGYWLAGPGKKISWLIFVVIFLFGLYFSYSRGAWLAVGAGILSYWLIKNKILVSTYFLSLIAVIIILLRLISNDNYLKFSPNYNKTIFHSDFRQHLRATYQLKDISTAERFYRWVAGARMVNENAFTGFGPNAFYFHYKEYAMPTFKTWVSNNPEKSTVHNYFLLLAIEQGLPGLILFLILIGVMLYYAQCLYHRIRDRFYKVVAITTGAILTMIIVLNFLSDLIETDKVGSLFFLCISMLIIIDVKTKNELNPPPDIQRIP